MLRMNTFVKRLKEEEKGIGLLEMIVSLTLLSIVTGVIYAVITFGLNSYQRVTVENSLRDESDLLMSTVIAELYNFGAESVRDITENGIPVGILLKKNEGETVVESSIRIKEGALVIEKGLTEKQIDVKSDIVTTSVTALDHSSTIKVECEGSVECRSGLIEIQLVLAQPYKHDTQTLTVRSKFGF